MKISCTTHRQEFIATSEFDESGSDLEDNFEMEPKPWPESETGGYCVFLTHWSKSCLAGLCLDCYVALHFHLSLDCFFFFPQNFELI